MYVGWDANTARAAVAAAGAMVLVVPGVHGSISAREALAVARVAFATAVDGVAARVFFAAAAAGAETPPFAAVDAEAAALNFAPLPGVAPRDEAPGAEMRRLLAVAPRLDETFAATQRP